MAKKATDAETSKATAPKKGKAPAEKAASDKAKKSAAPKKTATKASSSKKESATATAVAPKKKAPAKKTEAKAEASAKKQRVAEPIASSSKKQSAAPAPIINDEELPLEYGDTKVVLLTRDPEWVFVYWEINNDTRKQYGIQRGKHDKKLTLQLIEDTGNGVVRHPEVLVNDYTSSWYLRIPKAGSRYSVELGILDKGSRIDVIATSNVLHVPNMAISEETSVEFADISDEIYDQIVHLSGGIQLKERLGSDEFLRSLQQRVFDSLQLAPASSGMFSGSIFGMSSDVFSSGVFSGNFSSSFLTAMQPAAGGEATLKRPQAHENEFWLEVGVDVIVYGATQPDAKVKFMGQEAKLTEDGTFRFRMVFPDTEIDFPVEAVSADGKHKRYVKPIVKRSTEGDPRKPV